MRAKYGEKDVYIVGFVAVQHAVLCVYVDHNGNLNTSHLNGIKLNEGSLNERLATAPGPVRVSSTDGRNGSGAKKN